MERKTHELKTVQPYFDEVWMRNKHFECRLNDRDFNKYDDVILNEYDPVTDNYTGRYIIGTISYVLKDFKGLADGYVVFGLRSIMNFNEV